MLAGHHLRVTEGVADGEGHARDGHLDVGVAGEVLAAVLAFDSEFSALVESCQCRNAQVQLIVEERLRETGGEQVETAAPSLQGVVLRGSDGEGAEFQVPRQCLLQSGHDVGSPSAVALPQCVTAHIGVVESSVEEESGVFCGQPVHVSAETRLMTLHYVAVGGVQQVVAVVEAVLRDTVIHKVMVQVQVDHQFRGKHIVDQRYVVSLLHVEVGITIAQRNGVGLVHIRIQVRDTRTADAHIVGESQVAALRDVILCAGRRNQASVAGAEVVSVAQMILHVLPGVFVAKTCLQSELIEVAGIFAVACQDRVLVLVVGT